MAGQQKKLGTFDSVALLVGGMIGSAIFSLSGITILKAGPASIISWILGGIILLAYGLQTAELASLYPHSGGVFTFPAELLGKNKEQGRLWGWVSAWAYLFGCIAGAAFSAIYIGIYLGVAFPAFGSLQVPVALFFVIACGVLIALRFTITGRANAFLTLFLGLTLVVFIIVMFTSDGWNGKAFVPFMTQGQGGDTGFLDAIPIAMVAYGAIVALSFMVGEVENPNKTVPKAMGIAMGVVLALYLLVLIATMGYVSSDYLQKNVGMQYIPLYAAAFSLSSIPWLPKLISISATLALITTMIVTMALAARTLQACAENGLIAPALGKTHPKTGSPLAATLVIVVVTGALAAFPNITNILINLGALCNVIVIAIVCLSVMSARKKHPLRDPEHFRSPGGNVLPIITLIVLLVSYVPSVAQGGWQLWAYTALYYVLGMIIYALGRRHA